MNLRSLRFSAVLPLCLLLASCDSASGATDGVVMRCQEMATRQPELNLDPKKGCACASKKLRTLLLDEHYSLLERYSALITQIALDQPDLRGLESHDRALAALAGELDIGVDEVNELLRANVPFSLVRLAEQLCSE